MKYVLSWSGALIMLAVVVANVVAGGSPPVGFSPQSVTVSADATVAVDVTVANIDAEPGLGQYDLTLHFDPAVVRLDSFSDSGFVTSGQNVAICVTAQIDNAGGSANATCTAIQLFGAPGVSTTAAVALLHASFTTLAAGTSPLTLSGSLSDPAGTAIAASLGSGTIRVTNASRSPSPTTAATATAPSSPVPPATATATASRAPRAEATPSVRSPSGAAPTAITGTPTVAANGTGDGHGTSRQLLIALLAAGAVAIGATGSILVARRLRRGNHA